MIKTFDIVLDIEKDLYNPSNLLFTVSENDLDSVDLLFTITQDNHNLDLSGTTLELGIKKPSGLTVYQELEIINAVEGSAIVRMSLQSYNEYGVYTGEVYIRGIDTLAVTCPFYYSSREAIMNDETLESTNDWSAFQEVLFSYDKKPILTDGVPDFVPDYIGQMAFDTVGERAFIANDLVVEGWQLLAAGGDGTGGGLVSWVDILGKPSAFAPTPHIHAIADVTDLQAALDSKADLDTPAPTSPVDWVDITGKPDAFTPAAHDHNIGDIINLGDTLDGKANIGDPPTAHIHTIADITGLQGELDSKLEAIPPEYITETEGDTRYAFKGEGGTGGGSTLVENILTSTSTTAALAANQGRILNETKSDINHNHNDLYSPIDHTHSVDNIEGLSLLLDSKVDDTELGAYLTEVEADARYQQLGTDTITAWGDIGGTLIDQADLQAALDLKADDTDLAGYASIDHTHDFGSITDKPTTYPPSAHVHDFASITDKPTTYPPSAHTHDFASITDKPATYTPSAHIHAIADVTGLQPALDSKADDTDLAAKSDVGHTHDFGSITDKPATYPATAHTHDFASITDKPATYPATAHTHDFATGITGKPTTYPATAHTHDFTNDITGKPTTYPPSTHTHDYASITNKPATFVPQLMTGGQVGGAMVGNGLAMSGNFLTVKAGASLGVAADNSLQVQTTAATALRFWTGTQTAYDGLTKDANTLYFITGA